MLINWTIKIVVNKYIFLRLERGWEPLGLIFVPEKWVETQNKMGRRVVPDPALQMKHFISWLTWWHVPRTIRSSCRYQRHRSFPFYFQTHRYVMATTKNKKRMKTPHSRPTSDFQWLSAHLFPLFNWVIYFPFFFVFNLSAGTRQNKTREYLPSFSQHHVLSIIICGKRQSVSKFSCVSPCNTARKIV